MSSPARPKLLPNTDYHSTRYEVDVYFVDQWFLWHQRKDLARAQVLRDELLTSKKYPAVRLVAVTETRRIVQ